MSIQNAGVIDVINVDTGCHEVDPDANFIAQFKGLKQNGDLTTDMIAEAL